MNKKKVLLKVKEPSTSKSKTRQIDPIDVNESFYQGLDFSVQEQISLVHTHLEI
jgi:hypothetical protein